jgi:short subunit dehydrogenase-like uncharacterized protein
MARINTRVVRRSHALAGFPWGEGFVYREAMSTPSSVRGAGMAGQMAFLAFALKRRRLRELLTRRGPQPGQGPSPKSRERGHWKVRLIGEAGANGSAEVLRYTAAERVDAYSSSAKMLGESALCLALDPLTSEGGLLTPSVAMGGALLERLRRAGLTFAVAGQDA